MTYQLIQISPPQILRTHPDPLCGILTRGEVADPNALRDGLAWVPVIEQPEYDPATQYLVPIPITEGIGYEVMDFTEEEIEARKPRREVTKLQLMENMLTIGGETMWVGFEELRAQLPSLEQTRWQLATSISEDHPTVEAYGSTIQAALGLTNEQFEQILTPPEV